MCQRDGCADRTDDSYTAATAHCLLVLPPTALHRIGKLTECAVGGVSFEAHPLSMAAPAQLPKSPSARPQEQPLPISLEEQQHSNIAPLKRPLRQVVVHRGATDSLLRQVDPAAAARFEVLRAISPSGLLVDPLAVMKTFADRGALCEALSEIGAPVRQPAFFVWRGGPCEIEAGQPGLLSHVRASALRFPLLCKPIAACGLPGAHDLTFVSREEGLHELRPPFVLQDFVAHDGIMFKGYCVGKRLHVTRRPSLPSDLGSCSCDSSATEGLTQARQKELCGAATARNPGGDDGGGGDRSGNDSTKTRRSNLEVAPEDYARVCDIVRAVATHLGVRLLGVDVVVSEAGEFLVIDANHFPSSAQTFPDLPGALAELVLESTTTET